MTAPTKKKRRMTAGRQFGSAADFRGLAAAAFFYPAMRFALESRAAKPVAGDSAAAADALIFAPAAGDSAAAAKAIGRPTADTAE